MFFGRKTTTPLPNKTANDADLLKDMIRRLLKEIKEHDRDYKYITPHALIKEAELLLRDQ
jgi:hypothetical protein